MKKIKRIVLINILIILINLIFINVSFARDLDDIWDLRSSNNVGNEVYVYTGGPEDDTGNSYDIEMNDERDHIYCVQHDAESDDAWMKVDQYMEIRGDNATAYWMWNDKIEKRTIQSKYNIALAYLLGQENYRMGYSMNNNMRIRQEAVHNLLTHEWKTNIGTTLLWDKWFDAWHTDNSTARDFYFRALDYANNESTHCMPKINMMSKAYDKIEISGPYSFEYNGEIDWVYPKDYNDYWLGGYYYNNIWYQDDTIEYYKDAACTIKYEMTEIPNGEEFYIKNKSGKKIKDIVLKTKLVENKSISGNIEDENGISGPYNITYTGRIDWVYPKDQEGNWLGGYYENRVWKDDDSIKYYKDADCTQEYEMKEIPSGEDFYIKNSSEKQIKEIILKPISNEIITIQGKEDELAEISGPYTFTFDGEVDWICPKNKRNNWISGYEKIDGKWTYTKNIEFYKDENCEEKCEMTDIKSDESFYIKNTSNELMKEIELQVKSGKIYSIRTNIEEPYEITGPYYIYYNGGTSNIKWIYPMDQDGDWLGGYYNNKVWIDDDSIKYYKDAECTEEYKMTEIPSGAPFFIKNTSGKIIRQIILEKKDGNRSYIQTDMKTIETATNIIGPICLNFKGRMDWIYPLDENNNWMGGYYDDKGYWHDDDSIKYYKDANCQTECKYYEIKNNEPFYIKNNSNKTISRIHIKLKNNTIDCANIWFLERADGTDAQRLISATTRTEDCSAILLINIERKNGDLTIKKKDSITSDNITSPAEFKIRTSNGNWLTGTDGSYNYDNSDVSLATTYKTNENGILELKNLIYDTYEIYEVKSPDGYILSKQNGYDETNDWVNCGHVIVNGETEVEIKNDLIISISGYVWKDLIPDSKITDTNNLWDTNEEKIPEVIVRLMKKGNPPTEVATTTTGNDGNYMFKDIIKKSNLNDYYVEFNYNGLDQFKMTYRMENGEEDKYINYIPVAFNATSTNGSKAIVQVMPDYDRELNGIATTYMGQEDATKESQYGLEVCGTFNESERTLENINLGIKEVPKPQYDITQNLSSVKITMKGFTYTYVYGGERGESRIYAPTVTYQGRNDITAYERTFYPTDISYDKNNNVEELKAEVKYRIDIKNTETMNMESKYKEETMYLKQLVDEYDANRYTLIDANWTAGNVTTDSTGKKKQTATITNDYLNTIYDKELGILSNNTTTAYINFSVNHDAILDILNHPDGIIEEYPTNAIATAYHKYSRNDYSWENDILKEQTHYSVEERRDANAPYLIFKLGKERTIYGKVFEDNVVTDNGEKLGNGTNEEGENVVKGVKVELLDTTESDNTDFTKLSVSNLYTIQIENSEPAKEISKIALTETDENGNFILEGVVPGYYIIRYTYGDGTHKYTDSKGNEVSVDVLSKLRNSEGQEKNVLAKDYKSTIVTSQRAKDALENETVNTLTWYRHLEGENYSVAIDSLSKRKDINIDKENNIVSDMTDEEIDEAKANSIENEKNVMYSKTAKMFFSVENEDVVTGEVTIVKDDGGKDIQKEEYKNEIKGINLGIIEQPKQKAKVEKVITYVTLTNAQNNVVFDGNPENNKMQGVSDLDNKENGGSTYVRAEVIEDIIYSSKLELNYDIRVTNVSDVNYYDDKYYLYGDKNGANEITLKVNEVTDYLDETLKYLPEKSDKDRISTEIKTMKLDDRNTQVLKLNKWEGVLFTNKSIDNSRKTTDKVTIVAERTLSREDKDMEIINEAEITGIKHATETGDTNEEKLKIAPSEVHTNGRVKVVTSITPPTGENKQMITYYAIAGVATLLLLSVGIIIIKKKIK